jgi:hypothetical protein
MSELWEWGEKKGQEGEQVYERRRGNEDGRLPAVRARSRSRGLAVRALAVQGGGWCRQGGRRRGARGEGEGRNVAEKEKCSSSNRVRLGWIGRRG